MRTAITALTSVVVAALLTGCAGGDTPDTPDAAAPTADAPAVGDTGHDTGPRSGPGSGDPVVLTDVRLGAHEGYDRVVLEFSGSGTPGWTADYVPKAVLDGSGDVVELGGDSTLDVYASNSTWPAPHYYRGPERLTAANGAISEVYVAGTFEGTTQVLVGVDGHRAPFRVSTLTQPSRLVVDVAR